MILENGSIVTMDAAGTEHERGWVQIEDGLVAAVGSGDPVAGLVLEGGRLVRASEEEIAREHRKEAARPWR